MSKLPTLSRREFSAQAALALLGGAVVTIAGCSSDSNGNPAAPTPSAGDKTGTISGNHGHRAVVTGADLTAGNSVALDIQGDSTHPHTVQLSAQEVTNIRNGTRVSKASSNNQAHTHTVTFN